MTTAPLQAAPDTASRDRLCVDLATDLASLRNAVAQVGANLPPGSRPQLRQLSDAVAVLAADIDRVVLVLRQQDEPVPGAEMDDARFLRLLDIAGPKDSVELVARLHLDLKAVRAGLFAALDRREPDWEAVRAQTHVLIALAGAVGAEALQHLGETMNAAAHRRDLQEASDLRNDTAAGLDRLIAYIARRDTEEQR